MLIAALVPYGVVAACSFLMLRYELDVPSSIACMLTVPAVALGASLAGTATYVFSYSFFHSSVVLGVLIFMAASVYAVEFD